MKQMYFLASLVKTAIDQKRNQRLSREQIKILQQKKFLALVQFCSQRSPYYEKIIRAHKINVSDCKPKDFPVLTKSQLVDHFDEIVTDKRITRHNLANFLESSKDPLDLFLGKYTVIHSSGSSGTIGYYVYSQQELLTGLAPASRFDGFHLFQKMAYVAATRGHFAGITMVSTARKLKPIYTAVHALDINAPFERTIEALNTIQPTILNGYAFALRKLAEAQAQQELHIKPSRIQSGGEPLRSADKQFIQDIFKVPVENVYASSEHLIMGVGKDSFGGMFLMEDNLIFEPGPTGSRITNLYNYTLPLIRYQMNDYLEPITDTMKDLPFIKVKEVVGRQEAVPIFLNDKNKEDFISPILLVEFFVKGLARFQIELINQRSFVFYACLESDLSTSLKHGVVRDITDAMRAILAEKLMTKVTFSVQLVDQLWPDPKTGKFALIIRR